MNPRTRLARSGLVLLLLASLAWAGWSLQAWTDSPAPAHAEPAAPSQDACGHAGSITSLASEGFEDPNFPPPGGLWSIDPRLDQPADFGWGRVLCEAAGGVASLWSVGGGALGGQLSCDGAVKDYPEGPEGVHTLLRYGPIDLGGADAEGLRVTFDYLSKAPQGSLLVGVANLGAQGPVNYTGYTYFQADTAGAWVRDHTVNCDGGEFDTILAGIDDLGQIGIGFFYRDPTLPGSGPPARDMEGVFLDNVRIGLKSSSEPAPEPPAPDGQDARQTWLPVIQDFGDSDCEPQVWIQNLGYLPAKPILILWTDPSDCADPAGPYKVECGGLLAPGSAWQIGGSQVPEAATSGALYSFTAQTAGEAGIPGIDPEEVVADILCERLFFGVLDDADAFRDFKSAFDGGGVWSGIPMDRAWGSPLAVALHRSCAAGATDGARGEIEIEGIAADRLTAAETVGGDDGGTWHHYRLPARVLDRGYLYLQNAGLDCQRVEVSFVPTSEQCPSRDQPGPGSPVACSAGQTLAPGERLTVDLKACAGDATLGALWIRSDGPLAIVQDAEAEGAAQAGHEETGQQGNRLLAPFAFPIGSDWTLRALVQNQSLDATARVKLYWQDRSGDVVSTLTEDLCPGGAASFELGEIAPGAWTGSLRVESQPIFDDQGNEHPGPRISGFVELQREARRTQSGRAQLMRYPLVAEDDDADRQVDHGVIGLPRLRKVDGEPISQVAIYNSVGKPGFTDFLIYIFDANGLLDLVCQQLGRQVVEAIDLERWDYVTPGFVGSAVVSATYWEHDVFDGQGNLLRNPVDLMAVHALRSPDAVADPSDGSAASMTRLTTRDSLWGVGLLICPEGGPLHPRPSPTPMIVSPTPGAITVTPSPTPTPLDPGPETPTPARTATPDVDASETPTDRRPGPIYLPAILADVEPWPTGLILVVDTSPDEDSEASLEDEAPRGKLDATRRIGTGALSSLRAGTDLAGVVRYGSEGSAELYALSEDPAEIAARLSDFQPDRIRATTRPDLALAVAVTAFREMPERYAGRALLLFVDGRSQSVHLERAADRAATLRAGGARVFVIASDALDDGALLEAIAGQPGHLLRVDLDREAEVQRALATVDGWAARGWAGGAFVPPTVIQPMVESQEAPVDPSDAAS